MKVVTVTEYGGAAVLELTDVDRPEPRPGQVRIDVRAAGINFGDIMQRRGTYHGGPKPPFVPGMEVAGVVEAAGESADYEIGDRIAALMNEGGYADAAVTHQSVVFPLPGGMSFGAAAGFPVACLTAHDCLHDRGELATGDRVLIHAAAGSVGSAAVQLAREADAEIFGTASTTEKLAHAKSLGCDHPIEYTTEDFVEEVMAATDGEGVDLVLDGVGNGTAERSIDALVPFGRLVTYGAASGEPGRLSTDELLFSNTTVRGYHLEQTLKLAPERTLSAVEELTNALGEGSLEVQVGRSFDLADTARAHEFIESRSSIGKVVLRP